MSTKLTNREKWALSKLLDFDVARYLMANSCQRLDGAERAQRHLAISKTLCEFVLSNHKFKTLDELEMAVLETQMEVHNLMAQLLTDRMDEKIGFPVNTPLYGSDYDELKVKFMQELFNHFDDYETVVMNKLKTK